MHPENGKGSEQRMISYMAIQKMTIRILGSTIAAGMDEYASVSPQTPNAVKGTRTLLE